MKAAQLKAYEQAVLGFIGDRIASMGSETGGLNAYYAQRVAKQRALTRYEHELLTYLEGDRRIVHAGIGIGTLSAALALQGSDVLGFEFSPSRHDAAVALKQSLAPDTAYEIRSASFPHGLRADDDISSATLLFTNVASSWPEPLYDATIRQMSGFRRTILDLRLFGHTRNTQAERDSLAGRLANSGLRLKRLPLNAANSFYTEVSPS